MIPDFSRSSGKLSERVVRERLPPPPHNPGYDLYVEDTSGAVARWCEVKAMTGTLQNRPVGLSRTPFDFARVQGQSYWLYVVERAGTNSARIVRIQDPVGKARTFTFDRGWIEAANKDSSQRDRE